MAIPSFSIVSPIASADAGSLSVRTFKVAIFMPRGFNFVVRGLVAFGVGSRVVVRLMLCLHVDMSVCV